MDFIIGLPWSNGSNAVLVVVCRLTKMQYFIPCRDTYIAEQLADLYARPPRVLKGLVYLMTDKGPQQQWLYEIGKSNEPWCACDGWTPQNAAHLLRCPWVGDGRGRSSEQIWEDEKWCEGVADFIL